VIFYLLVLILLIKSKYSFYIYIYINIYLFLNILMFYANNLYFFWVIKKYIIFKMHFWILWNINLIIKNIITNCWLCIFFDYFSIKNININLITFIIIKKEYIQSLVHHFQTNQSYSLKINYRHVSVYHKCHHQ